MSEHFTISETHNEQLQRNYSVVIAADYIEQHVDKELKKIGKKAKIPGFRPGKVPLDVLRQRHKQSVLGDVINATVDEAVNAAFKQHDVAPALQPDVKIESYEDGQDMTLSVSLEIMPESPEIDFSSITIEKPVIPVSDEDVDNSLTRMAQTKRKTEDKAADVQAENGDIVVIDFTGYLNGELFEGGAGKEFSLELGSNQFIPGFEEQLVGVKAGDTIDVNVAFPEAYHSEELAGKETRFEVVVHKVQQVQIPEMNDELAKEFGQDSLDGLKTFVREQLAKEYEGMTRNYLKKQLFDALEAKCDFTIPQKMQELEFDSIWKQATEEAKRDGREETDIESEKDDYQAIAKRRVQLGILLSQTAGRNNIEVNQQDIQSALLQQARMYPGQEHKVIEFFQKNPDQMRELRGPILEEKAVDFILDKVTFEETEKTLDEVTKMETDNAASATSDKKTAEKSSAPKKKAASSDETSQDESTKSSKEKESA